MSADIEALTYLCFVLHKSLEEPDIDEISVTECHESFTPSQIFISANLFLVPTIFFPPTLYLDTNRDVMVTMTTVVMKLMVVLITILGS